MDAEEAIAREAMRETLARYNHAGDRGRLRELAECFTADGVLEIAGEPLLEGRAAIEAHLRGIVSDVRGGPSRPALRLRHHVSSVLVERTSRDEGEGFAYFLVVTDIGPDHWGTYRDRFQKDGDRWLLAHRGVRVEGAAPNTHFAGRV